MGRIPGAQRHHDLVVPKIEGIYAVYRIALSTQGHTDHSGSWIFHFSCIEYRHGGLVCSRGLVQNALNFAGPDLIRHFHIIIPHTFYDRDLLQDLIAAAFLNDQLCQRARGRQRVSRYIDHADRKRQIAFDCSGAYLVDHLCRDDVSAGRCERHAHISLRVKERLFIQLAVHINEEAQLIRFRGNKRQLLAEAVFHVQQRHFRRERQRFAGLDRRLAALLELAVLLSVYALLPEQDDLVAVGQRALRNADVREHVVQLVHPAGHIIRTSGNQPGDLRNIPAGAFKCVQHIFLLQRRDNRVQGCRALRRRGAVVGNIDLFRLVKIDLLIRDQLVSADDVHIDASAAVCRQRDRGEQPHEHDQREQQ